MLDTSGKLRGYSANAFSPCLRDSLENVTGMLRGPMSCQSEAPTGATENSPARSRGERQRAEGQVPGKLTGKLTHLHLPCCRRPERSRTRSDNKTHFHARFGRPIGHDAPW